MVITTTTKVDVYATRSIGQIGLKPDLPWRSRCISTPISALRTQMVDGLVVRNTHQPGFEILNLGLWQFRMCDEQNLLHDILGADRRTDHPGTVPVQFWTDRAELSR